ncbi:DivIVA domain-containing protein [Saccharothrix tamanrassetensis]|uniref:Cell wall synthesis protein Wag31 n=1 Tax=Saccharothrix tamanrassetensis TaxID=1051531 RepID=A0A841CL78_9PSEU|nr:DivIVA domain-containing protein [Saccharothrix tamanrassetensis]MBB5956346.1 DivIVA domain-containing protein [Saccharothrix tamanrassetensis]
MAGFEARQHTPAHPAPLLSAQDLRQVAFHRPPPGQPGYDEQQVDDFLDRIEATLLGRDDVGEQDVRRMRFRPARPGYHAAEVDVFMDLVAETLRSTPQRRQAVAPAQGAHATSTGMRPAPRLTPQDVRGVRFHKPRPGNRGYAEGEIDAFLERIEATLAGRDSVTAIEVQEEEFSFAPPGQVGYDEDDVDTFLDLVVVTLERTPVPPVRPRPGVGTRPLTARDVRTVEFGKPPRGRRGYQESQVDRFLDRIENTLLGQGDLTAQEIREVRFSRPIFGRRGYDETEVDAFLARVEKQLGDGPTRPSAIPPITSWKQLRAVKLPLADPTQRGYRTSQVDRVLEEVGIALDGMIGASSADVAKTRFTLSMVNGQGYDCTFIDELMPLLVTELRRRGR